MKKTIVQIAFVLLIISDVDGFFKNSLKKLKEKAKNFYKQNKKWEFLGNDQTEYPGTNPEYRRINSQKWEEYYECLNGQLEKFGTMNPDAIQAYEGSWFIFDCGICLSPLEEKSADSVEWIWASVDSKHFTPITYTEHIFLSPKDKSLHIYSLEMGHTGQYVCKMGQTVTAPYFLTVVNGSDDNIREVHSMKAPHGPYPKKPEKIQNYDLILDTRWGPWSKCSKCNEIGRKHKLGYCIIKPANNASVPKKRESKLSDQNVQLVQLFKAGIPCISHVLPKAVKDMPQVKNRQNEMMMGYCKPDCPEEKVFEVKDRDGNVLETANNSAGVYSMLQGKPDLEPPVERTIQYEIKGKKAVLTCPGNVNDDIPVQWQMSSQKLRPEALIEKTNGRMYISLMDKIHIKEAKLSDSNIYSCWQHNELIGTIRLVVEKKIVLTFNHHLMLLGMIVILGTFCYVFVKSFHGKQYATFN